MKIAFWSVGKSHDDIIKPGVDLYTKRIGAYFPVEWHLIAPPKSSAHPEAVQKKEEAQSIRSLLKPGDYLVALDERGATLTSDRLSQFVEQRASSSVRRLLFLIGGAYGIDAALLQESAFRWSLSALTFPHQLVRLILAEQVYRACTILRNEKYHHR